MNARDEGRILVVCKDSSTLDVVDGRSWEVVGSIAASGYTPHEVTASPDGRVAYLPIFSDVGVGAHGTDGRAIDVIDLVNLTLARTVALPFAARPHQPVVGPDGLLYVTTELDDSISVFDPATIARLDSLPTGREQSHMLALTPDGTRAITANVSPGSVSVIEVEARFLVGVVELADEVNRIALSADGSLAYTADQHEPRLAVVDVASVMLREWIDLPGIAFGTAATVDGKQLVMALPANRQVGILDLASGGVTTLIDVPAHPQAIVIHPDGRHAYTACAEDDSLVEIDLAAGRVTRRIEVGKKPDGIAWAPMPA